MARFPYAHWIPADQPVVPYTGGPFRVVHHKTQGNGDDAHSLFGGTGSWPHFTISDGDCQQHYDTSVGSRALVHSGNPDTNAEHCVQIEVVGFSGQTMTARTMDRLIAVLKWLDATHGIPWNWPMGRPPTDSASGAGVNNGHRDAAVWTNFGGHYGHSQVPENDHWDPAYTDLEWWVLNKGMLG